MQADRTVLVAEDDELIRAIMCEVLIDYGFTPAPAANAEEAIRVIEQRDDLRAAFIDIDLPERGAGYVVARRMLDLRPGVKIVFTSGGARADYERQHVEGSEFVQKPYMPERVCDLIAERLG